ncbi:portal protein [Anaerofustis stercorihominis]|uniref:portal protein n=1 Tax=Anaerofustis stercorihominis TaxID=214853 RepID=UPI00214B6CE6|nr:hypothetical protein [Anaerofustis stercorihominis]MCR2033696.1 hypothetical protein [Anaerofustis stercorihominis]
MKYIKKEEAVITDKKEAKYDEHEICSFIFDLLEKKRRERLPYELKWRLAINFLQGDQYSYIDSVSGGIMEVDNVQWWQEREVFNQIAPIYDTRLAKLSKLKVLMNVRPATNSKDDVKSSKVCKKILESIEEDLEMKKLQKQANIWAEKTGSAIWGVFWDKNKGKTIGYKEQYVKKENSDKKEKINAAIKEGGINYEIISPFDFFPSNVYVKDIESLDYAIWYKVMSVKEIENMFNTTVEGYENNVVSYSKARTNVGGLGSKGHGYSESSKDIDLSAEVISYFEKPTNRYPKGRYIVCTKDNVLHMGDLPYINAEDGERELPFVIQKSLDYGEFFGESIINRLIPLQRRFNNIKNRKQEYLNRVAIGQITYEKGSIDEDDVLDMGLAPGAVIPRRQGSEEPSYLRTPALPSTILSDEKATEELFITLSGVSEMSRNSYNPKNVTSGVALSLLQDQDDTRLALNYENMYDTRIKIAKQTLRILKNSVTTPRLSKYVDMKGQVEVFYWDGTNINSTDIYIDSTSLLAKTPESRRELVLDLMERGLFNDPDTGKVTKETLVKLFEMIELGNWEDYCESVDPNISKVDRENINMLKGREAKFKPYDEHQLHKNEHINFMLSEEFENACENDGDLENRFLKHIELHDKALNSAS